MRRRKAGLIAGLATLLVLPISAWAQAAYTRTELELLAGPAADYPVVANLGAGTSVAVQGCVADYTWCDVAVGDLRGWVYGAYLDYPYQSSMVPLASYGALIGIPVLGFALASYWDSFYRGRPWYGDRWRWAQRAGPGFVQGPRPGFAPPVFRPAAPAAIFRPSAPAPQFRPGGGYGGPGAIGGGGFHGGGGFQGGGGYRGGAGGFQAGAGGLHGGGGGFHGGGGHRGR